MTQKMLLAAAAALALSLPAGAAFAFPVAPMQSATPAETVTKVTFWGHPFPYKYTWSVARACSRLETVETSRGSVTRRVWVCGVRRGETVVSYRE